MAARNFDEIQRDGVGGTPKVLRYDGRTPAVQLDLPFLRSPASDSRSTLTVEFVRTRRARRYIVRVRHDGTVRVTIPRGGSRAEGVRFLERQSAWIANQRARVLAAHVTPSWTDGAQVMLRGELVILCVRRSAHDGHLRVEYGDRSVRVAGAQASIRACVEADLRDIARAELGKRLFELAAAHQLVVSAFSIRNQRSRWGSCSRAGRIALNYRLVQMPPAVSDYVILHELMHLREQNHSRRFWQEVERVCPDFRDSEHWLRVHGPGLL
jgi:predicted metal-dependent hydrolase